MQVALVLDRFDPLHGGLEHWAFQYASWLTSQGHQVHVVARQFAPEMSGHPFVLHALKVEKSWPAFAAAAEQRVRSLPIDIVHDLGSGWYFDILQPQFGSRLADRRQNLLALPLLQRWRRRFSRSFRRDLRQVRAFEERQYRSTGGRIIAVSEMTAGHLQCFNHVSPGRMTVIHNGVDTSRFAPPQNSTMRDKIRKSLNLENKVVLLFAAHNFRLKGLLTLLQALRHLQGEPLHALIVGRGEIEKYRGFATRLGVTEQVTFCDFVEDIRDYYHTADLHVHPTFYDPCSLAVLEALACGLPVITSWFNGAAEMIENGVQGFVLQNPASATELAGIVRRLMKADVRTRMGLAARAAALTQGMEKSFERIFETYHTVQKSNQGRESRAWE